VKITACKHFRRFETYLLTVEKRKENEDSLVFVYSSGSSYLQ